MRILFILFFCYTCSCLMYAQVPPISAAQAQAELQKKGITEAELKAKLLEKGINLDNIDPTNPTEVAQAQKAIEEAIKEIEAEKQQGQGNNSENNKPTENLKEVDSIKETAEEIKQTIEDKVEDQIGKASQESVEEISEAVEEGKSIEEAVAEEASELIQDQLSNSNIYGQQLFRNKTLKLYTKSEDVLPPETYVLGSGDEINISIWGISQADFNLEIQNDGYVYPSGVARAYLKGLTLNKAKSLLRSRLSNFYQFRPEEFEVNLKFVRTLNVNIWGEGINIGSFNIPATNTAFNALVAAGGPSDIGSVRNIQLIRSNGNRKVDIYSFMNDPSVQNDLYLQNNDVLYIPIAEKLITVKGAVKRPMTYELIDGENLFQLIEYAGGLKVNAYTEILQIERIQNNQRNIIDINLQDLLNTKKDFVLLNGDIVSVKEIPRPFQNYVDISGAIEFPGRFALESEMRVLDLINKGVLLPESRKDIAFLLRTNNDQTATWEKIDINEIQSNPNSPKNVILKPKDKIQIYDIGTYVDKSSISISGAVRSPGEFPYDTKETIKIEDLILLGGGLVPDAAEIGYIKRVDPTDKTKRDYIKVNIFEALSNSQDTSNNMILQPLDQLVVYSKNAFQELYNVSIQGAVRNPSEYAYDDGLRVSDLIYFANGLKADATDFGYIIRTDINNSKIQQYIRIDDLNKIVESPTTPENIYILPKDVLMIYSKLTYTDESVVSVEGAVRSPGEYKFDPTLSLKDVLTMAGGLKLEASLSKIDIFRVIINKDQPTKTVVATLEVNENYDIAAGGDLGLQPYDKVVVRTVPDFEFQKMVRIGGEVNHPGVYALTGDDDKILDVVRRAGGLTGEAFPEGTTLRRSEDGIGLVITRLDKVLIRPESRFNYILKEGDLIEVPKSKDLVTIELGATLASELYPEKITSGGKISMAYNSGKRSNWYVKEYAAGINRKQRARKRFMSVEYPNGQLKRGNIFFTPKTRPGSIVSVGVKPEKVKKEKPEKEKGEPVDWGQVVQNSIALVGSLLTIVVLVDRL
ncbi:MAG: SLBB domain-containing protein [Bacteroidetes bacterium]|nr:SLBB domain-containing protein [Bacteroidota bacterium]